MSFVFDWKGFWSTSARICNVVKVSDNVSPPYRTWRICVQISQSWNSDLVTTRRCNQVPDQNRAEFLRLPDCPQAIDSKCVPCYPHATRVAVGREESHLAQALLKTITCADLS